MRTAHQPIRVVLVKHETERLGKVVACGEFMASASSWLCGMAGQLKGSNAGAGMAVLPFRSTPSTGADTEMRGGLALGMAAQQCWGTRSAMWGIEVPVLS